MKRTLVLLLLALVLVTPVTDARPGGQLWAWGNDDHGQLGPAAKLGVANPIPASVELPAPVVGAAGGWYHTALVLADGTVWTIGVNRNGQLGRCPMGSNLPDPIPRQVVGLTDAISVAAGMLTTYVLRRDGTVWAFGSGSNNELGDGTSYNSCDPVEVPIDGVISIAAQQSGALALRADGSLWGWGDNGFGELGVPPSENYSLPVKVAIDHVKAIFAGWHRAIAIKDDGTAWGWGSGLTGRYLKVEKTSIVELPITGAKAFSFGYNFTLVLFEDRTVKAWGGNSYGQLGNGLTEFSSIPLPVLGLEHIITIATGYYHALAQRDDGVVFGWGYDHDGQSGSPKSDGPQPIPLPLEIHGSFVAAGWFHSLAGDR